MSPSPRRIGEAQIQPYLQCVAGYPATTQNCSARPCRVSTDNDILTCLLKQRLTTTVITNRGLATTTTSRYSGSGPTNSCLDPL